MVVTYAIKKEPALIRAACHDRFVFYHYIRHRLAVFLKRILNTHLLLPADGNNGSTEIDKSIMYLIFFQDPYRLISRIPLCDSPQINLLAIPA